MHKQDLQFQIDQLRKDKIIYAVESTATSVTAIVAMFYVGSIEKITNPFQLHSLILGGAIVYWIYMVISNLLRYLKIRRLESELAK